MYYRLSFNRYLMIVISNSLHTTVFHEGLHKSITVCGNVVVMDSSICFIYRDALVTIFLKWCVV